MRGCLSGHFTEGVTSDNKAEGEGLERFSEHFTGVEQFFVAVGRFDEDLESAGDARQGVIAPNGAMREQIVEMGERIDLVAEMPVLPRRPDGDKIEVCDADVGGRVFGLFPMEVLLDLIEPVGADDFAGALTHETERVETGAVVADVGQPVVTVEVGGDAPEGVEEPATGATAGHAVVGQYFFKGDRFLSPVGEHAVSFDEFEEEKIQREMRRRHEFCVNALERDGVYAVLRGETR